MHNGIGVLCNVYLLKRELQDLQRSTGPKHSATSKSPYDKIVAENERLAKDYKREVAKTERLQLALTTLEIQRDKLAQEVERFSSRPPGVPPSSPKKATPGPQLGHQGSEGHGGLEVKVEQLQAEVEKKTSMLLEVKKHLKEAAKREMELKALSSDAQVGSIRTLNLPPQFFLTNFQIERALSRSFTDHKINVLYIYSCLRNT